MNDFEGKTIFITGASGFIGSHLTKRLAGVPGVRLLLLSRQARESAAANMQWLCSELEHLNRAFWKSRAIDHIDYVIHLGGFVPKSGVEAGQTNRAINANILGTQALIESLPCIPRKLCFASTLDVYSKSDDGQILTEQSPTTPGTVYGASKLFCEAVVSAWAKERGVNYSVLRYGHIYGPGEEKYQKLIPAVIRSLMAGQIPEIHGDGSALRDYLYVADAVEATLRSIAIDGDIGPVNIVRGESVPVGAIVELLIALAKKKGGEMRFLADQPNGNSLRFDNTLMRKLLGEWPVVELEQGLLAELASFRGDAT